MIDNGMKLIHTYADRLQSVNLLSWFLCTHTHAYRYCPFILTSTDLNLSSRDNPILPIVDDELDEMEDNAADVGLRMVPNDPDIRLIASLPFAHTCFHPITHTSNIYNING